MQNTFSTTFFLTNLLLTNYDTFRFHLFFLFISFKYVFCSEYSVKIEKLLIHRLDFRIYYSLEKLSVVEVLFSPDWSPISLLSVTSVTFWWFIVLVVSLLLLMPCLPFGVSVPPRGEKIGNG